MGKNKGTAQSPKAKVSPLFHDIRATDHWLYIEVDDPMSVNWTFNNTTTKPQMLKYARPVNMNMIDPDLIRESEREERV